MVTWTELFDSVAFHHVLAFGQENLGGSFTEQTNAFGDRRVLDASGHGFTGRVESVDMNVISSWMVSSYLGVIAIQMLHKAKQSAFGLVSMLNGQLTRFGGLEEASVVAVD